MNWFNYCILFNLIFLFSWGEENVSVRDALGATTIYRYDPSNHRLAAIEEYDNDHKLCCTEALFWGERGPGAPKLLTKLLTDHNGTTIRQAYIYNEQGNLIEEIVDNGTAESPDSLDGVTERRHLRYTLNQEGLPEICEECVWEPNSKETIPIKKIHNTYSSDGKLSRQDFYNPLGEHIHYRDYVYDGNHQLKDIFDSRDQETNIKSTKAELFFDNVIYFCNRLNHVLSYLKQYSYEKSVQPEIEEFGKQLFGTTFLAMSGYYADSLEEGVYGEGELGPHVRVTAINGILNLRGNCIRYLNDLSVTHGGVNIHYVFNPTEGWAADMFKATLAKFGHVSPQVRSLAATWKKLIKEMGGTDSGGVIVHYAHSIGGTHTAIARSLLTPEEQKMIRVITVGSASILSNEGFAEISNYVSWRDGVGFIASLVHWKSDVVYVGSLWGVPFIDHLLSMDTYKQLMNYLGKEFTEKHGTIRKDEGI